jgi:hypothetical protein
MGEHGRERQLCLSEIIELVRTRVRDRRIGDPRNREKRGLALQVFGWQRQMKRRGLQRDTVYLVRPDGYPAVAAPPN